MATTTITKSSDKVEAGQSAPTVVKDERSWLQEKYESFWLYPESHPWRLAQHITIRGFFAGSTLAFLGAVPFALLKRRGRILTTVGKVTLRGAAIGGVLMGAAAAERWYHLEQVGIEDRAYRISYNWGQTKWDYIALDGAIVSMFLFRRSLGGVLPAAAVGMAGATLLCAEAMLYNKFAKKQ